jgi:hypothetical protein
MIVALPTSGRGGGVGVTNTSGLMVDNGDLLHAVINIRNTAKTMMIVRFILHTPFVYLVKRMVTDLGENCNHEKSPIRVIVQLTYSLYNVIKCLEGIHPLNYRRLN